jgi:hypothetical protein
MSEANHKSRGRRVAASEGENASTRTAGIIELSKQIMPPYLLLLLIRKHNYFVAMRMRN